MFQLDLSVKSPFLRDLKGGITELFGSGFSLSLKLGFKNIDLGWT